MLRQKSELRPSAYRTTDEPFRSQRLPTGVLVEQ